MRINNESLELLRYHVLADSSISDEQRQKNLDTISYVEEGLASGEFVAVNRLDLIKSAAKKTQSKKNVTLRKKLKAKSRKVVRNATEDERTMRSMGAFDESFMFSSDKEIRKYADSMGITDTYKETKRFDEEWN
jgi:hypothetical protein